MYKEAVNDLESPQSAEYYSLLLMKFDSTSDNTDNTNSIDRVDNREAQLSRQGLDPAQSPEHEHPS
jgi:hypothetical protein